MIEQYGIVQFVGASWQYYFLWILVWDSNIHRSHQYWTCFASPGAKDYDPGEE